MGVNVRRATAADAPGWLDLVQATVGTHYPVKNIYDPGWIASQLKAEGGQETWVADGGGRLNGSITFLKPHLPSSNPVANLGRNIFRPESFKDGSAAELLKFVNELVAKRKEMAIARISATDQAQQVLFEGQGYVCVGFQPIKHLIQQRVGVLFYVRGASSVLVNRAPLSESLPQVSELGSAVLARLQIPNTMTVRDGANGYPLQCDLKIQEASRNDFDLARAKSEGSKPPAEVSGRFNFGLGLMRMPANLPIHALLARQGENVVAGLSYYFDEHDRCARIIETFCGDDLSLGGVLAHALRVMQDQLGAVYTEVDILATAPRLLKSAEQLGFVPVAYLPAFYSSQGKCSDVVKMVKLNVPYSLEDGNFTAHARSSVEIIDRIFEDQKHGQSIINLLRPLPIFAGLGDGELRKFARLFQQKLYRPDEQIFAKGDAGDEAFIVLRGKISIHLDLEETAVSEMVDGKIFGELAFLDGAPRAAYAIASQASILLVLKRADFDEIVRREPNLGMVVMRNLAHDLALKLRHVNEALGKMKRAPVKA